MKPENDLFEIHSDLLRSSFWTEVYPVKIHNALMLLCKPEIIRYWAITDIKDNLAKWSKRPIPLTDEELRDFFPDYKPEKS